MKEQIIKVNISELKDSFYVRTETNQKHVEYLASLIGGDVDLGPIRITDDYKIIDGRHRVEATKFLNLPTIRAIVEKDGDLFLLVKKALSSNMGGALPNTREDLRHSITFLIEQQQASYQKIITQLSDIYPHGMIKAIYGDAISRINNKKLAKALFLLRDGNITLSKAADAVGIPEKYLSDAIKRKGTKLTPQRWIADEKLLFKRRYSHVNKCNAQARIHIFQKFDDGELRENEVDSFLDYFGQQVARQQQIYSDWRKRWNVKKGNKASK